MAQKKKTGALAEWVGDEAVSPDALTVSAKEEIRRRLQADMEAFLQSGGQVEEIAPHVSADPPTKPITSYGSRPI